MSLEDRRKKRLERFRETARERVWKINLLWIQVEQGQSEDTAIAEILRELHTLKGETSLMGFSEAAEVAHAIEDALGATGKADDLDPELGDHVLSTLDLIAELLAAEPSPEITRAVRDRVGKLRLLMSARSSPASASQSLAQRTGTESASTSVAPGFSVKVTHAQLDRIRDIIGDLLLTRTRLRSTAGSLRQARGSQTDGGRLDRALVEIEHSLRDDVVRMGTLVDGLEGITRELRMVPISVLFERFPRAARDLARDLGKQIQVVHEGKSVELDREILESLSEPLLHLIRNAVDHGLELPAERRRAGKPVVGTLTLKAEVAGRYLDVEVRDDGRGIDGEAVRKHAVDNHMLVPESARVLTHDQLLGVLVAPGMTTRTEVTNLSGRGVGLDVVHQSLRSLGGTLSLDSKTGAGTTFKLSVPISMAITTVVLFDVGAATYAIAASDVHGLIEAEDYPLVDSLSGASVYFEGSLLPVVELGELLGEPDVEDTAARAARLLVVHTGSGRLALAGGRRFSQRDVVLKTAGSLLGQDRLVSAGVALEDGAVALVLSAQSIQQRSAGWAPSPAPLPGDAVIEVNRARTVLVADDSPVVLDLIAETLRSYGLTVVEACDGREALDILDGNPNIDMLVTDIEMPRMDGLSLVSELRERKGRRIPAIVVSTRGSDADKMAALQVGADAYLVKSDFSKDSLWALVCQFVS